MCGTVRGTVCGTVRGTVRGIVCGTVCGTVRGTVCGKLGIIKCYQYIVTFFDTNAGDNIEHFKPQVVARSVRTFPLAFSKNPQGKKTDHIIAKVGVRTYTVYSIQNTRYNIQDTRYNV